MLPEGVYSDNFGGGYFSQYVVWWWVPTLTVIVAVAALPSVPYAKRIGARGVIASLVNKVICSRNIVGFACTTGASGQLAFAWHGMPYLCQKRYVM